VVGTGPASVEAVWVVVSSTVSGTVAKVAAGSFGGFALEL